MAKEQKLTREVVEYAFSEIMELNRDDKYRLKMSLRDQRSVELGRKLRRELEMIFSEDDRKIIKDYLVNRTARHNALITMVVILCCERCNEYLIRLSNIHGPVTAKQIESVIGKTSLGHFLIEDANKRLNDFIRHSKYDNNTLLRLGSNKRIQIVKSKSNKGRTILWSSSVFNASEWKAVVVKRIIIEYDPARSSLIKIVGSIENLSYAVSTFKPLVCEQRVVSSYINVYFIHDSSIAHSRYVFDNLRLVPLFEREALQCATM